MVVTNRSKSSNASQTLITSGGGIYIRARISNEWTPWQQQETTTGAQAKVDAHANKKDNPHGFTAAQLGLPNASTQNDYVRLGGNTGSSALGSGAVIIGKNAARDTNFNGAGCVIIGRDANNDTQAKAGSIAIGYGARPSANYATALGRNSEASQPQSVALGFESLAQASRSFAIGNQASSLNTAEGVLGGASAAHTHSWYIPG